MSGSNSGHLPSPAVNFAFATDHDQVQFQKSKKTLAASPSTPPPSMASSYSAAHPPAPSSSFKRSPPHLLAKSVSQYESGNGSSFVNALYEDEDQVDGCLTPTEPATPDPEDEQNRSRFRRGWAASSTTGRGALKGNDFQASTRSSESVLEKYRNQLNSRTATDRDRSWTRSEQYKLEHPNRPSNARWRQQALPAWQPIFRPLNIMGTFLGVGLLLVALGVLMLISSLGTQEVSVDYTDCVSADFAPKTCAQVLEASLNAPATPKCTCSLPVTIPTDMGTPVYLYYALDGFYQNHRRYVSSVDANQLAGSVSVSRSKLKENCYPFAMKDNDEGGAVYAPCGAVANSLFTDAFTLKYGSSPLKVHQKDISWDSDRRLRYHNPSTWQGTVHPRNWTVDASQLGPPEAGTGYENEHLIVWMRTAAFPAFRKLWGRIDPGSLWSHTEVLKAGEYILEVDYNYRTVLGDVRIPKTVLISNTSWLGGRNLFLPILYIVVGGLSIITAILFLIIKWKVKPSATASLDRMRRSVKQPNYQTMTSTTEGQNKLTAPFPISEEEEEVSKSG